jgi:hypothetical protein
MSDADLMKSILPIKPAVPPKVVKIRVTALINGESPPYTFVRFFDDDHEAATAEAKRAVFSSLGDLLAERLASGKEAIIFYTCETKEK